MNPATAKDLARQCWRAMATNVSIPSWENLGQSTQELWYERVQAGMRPADYLPPSNPASIHYAAPALDRLYAPVKRVIRTRPVRTQSAGCRNDTESPAPSVDTTAEAPSPRTRYPLRRRSR